MARIARRGPGCRDSCLQSAPQPRAACLLLLAQPSPAQPSPTPLVCLRPGDVRPRPPSSILPPSTPPPSFPHFVASSPLLLLTTSSTLHLVFYFFSRVACFYSSPRLDPFDVVFPLRLAPTSLSTRTQSPPSTLRSRILAAACPSCRYPPS